MWLFYGWEYRFQRRERGVSSSPRFCRCSCPTECVAVRCARHQEIRKNIGNIVWIQFVILRTWVIPAVHFVESFAVAKSTLWFCQHMLTEVLVRGITFFWDLLLFLVTFRARALSFLWFTHINTRKYSDHKQQEHLDHSANQSNLMISRIARPRTTPVLSKPPVTFLSRVIDFEVELTEFSSFVRSIASQRFHQSL